MKTTFLIAAIAAGMTLAATADARQGDRQGARMEMPAFEDIDANGDGSVTAEEITAAMQARSAERFTQTDTNGDGGLSAEELTANADAQRAERAAERVAEHIERADTNGDGLLQADEIAAQGEDRRDDRRGGGGPERLFERFDENEDGALSADEFAEAQARMEDRGDRRPRGDN